MWGARDNSLARLAGKAQPVTFRHRLARLKTGPFRSRRRLRRRVLGRVEPLRKPGGWGRLSYPACGGEEIPEGSRHHRDNPVIQVDAVLEEDTVLEEDAVLQVHLDTSYLVSSAHVPELAGQKGGA